jgi:hypothetical protein
MNKVFMDMLESKTQRAELAMKLINGSNLPMIEMIPCFCDILKSGGVSIFVNDKPEHPFVKTLDRMASKIENL